MLYYQVIISEFRSMPVVSEGPRQGHLPQVVQERLRQAGVARQQDKARRTMEQGRSRSPIKDRAGGSGVLGEAGSQRGGGHGERGGRRGGGRGGGRAGRGRAGGSRGGRADMLRGQEGAGGQEVAASGPGHGGDSQPSESSGQEDRDYSTAEEERESNETESRSRRRMEVEEGISAIVPTNILKLLMPVAVIERVSPRVLLMLMF